METSNSNFIEQTAFDYCLGTEVVERIYKKSTNSTDFYKRLESEMNNEKKCKCGGLGYVYLPTFDGNYQFKKCPECGESQ